MASVTHWARAAWLGLLIGVGLLGGCGPTSFLITPVPTERDLRETVVLRESTLASKRLALVDVDGLLQNGRPQSLTGVPGENPVSLFKEKLDKAAADDRVKAVVVRINTPGGTVTASDIMYAELVAFRERTGKPVVACLMDLGTSGGYYLACAADRIVAHPTTITGSIGVVMLSPNVAGTLDRIGAAVHIFRSGPLKDAGSPFRAMTDADRAVFQKLIDSMYARFLDVVARGRPNLTREQIATLADGRVFLGPEALAAGLVDQIGSLDGALFEAKRAAGLEKTPVLVVQYSRPLAHRPNVYAQGDPGPPAMTWPIALPSWLTHSTPQALYLWAPGW